MRTKTLLLTAALSAAGVATSMAQVYSVNAVGYVNTVVPPKGFAFVNVPLIAPNNTINSLIPPTVDGMVVYLYRAGDFVINSISKDDVTKLLVWDDATVTINPGEGFVVKNPSATAATLTFVGDVPQGSLSHPIPSGFSLQASEVPQAGLLESVLGFKPVNGDKVYQLDAGQNFIITQYGPGDVAGTFAWDNTDGPTIGVGEGFWLFNKAAVRNYTRTFSVNP